MIDELSFSDITIKSMRREIQQAKNKLVWNLQRDNITRYLFYLNELMAIKIKMYNYLKGKKLSPSLKNNIDYLIRSF